MAPIYWLMLFVSLATHTAVLCQEEYTNCTSNYTVLENAMFHAGDNIYQLTTTFFSPHVNNPLYVTVTYNFSNTNESVQYIGQQPVCTSPLILAL